MFNALKGISSAHSLPEPQRRMYESEATDNFRWLAKFAERSSYTLTPSDLAPASLHVELGEIGQFAEVAHGSLSPEFIWNNMEALSQPGFPLERYNALRGSILVSAFRGTVSNMQAYIAYRPQTKQLIVAFSGTSSIYQALRNIDARLIRYPHGDRVGCSVHSGFWKMYNGLRSRALSDLSTQALSAYTVEEIVFTGHSLGSIMCYLLALDVMQGHNAGNGSISTDIPLTIVAFGSPRVGNQALMQYWRDTVAARSSRGGSSVKEYSVKGYNDGVPTVPPYRLGFRHFTQTPLYFAEGHLYHIPAAESEYSLFSITRHESEDAADDPRQRQPCLDYPLGGHNYYNSRDMEELLRRMKWFNLGRVDWEGYREWLKTDQ